MSRYLALAFTLSLPASALAQTATPSTETRPAASPATVTAVPRVKNLAEVVARLDAEYPPDLRDAGISGLVHVRIMVGVDGVPGEFEVVRSSGNAQFDSAAIRVASVLRYHPATADGKPVPLRATVPIRFVAEEDPAPAAPASAAPATRVAAPVGRRASGAAVYEMIDVDRVPEVANLSVVVGTLGERYPARLREAGIGGNVVVTMIVGTDGRPTDPSVANSSGNAELDAVAVDVAKLMRFRPAMVNKRPVAARVSVPLTFDADSQ